MTEKVNIHKKIVNIMSELSYIEKGSAKVNGQYRFVSHDQVVAKVHPLLVKHGVTVIPTVEDMKQEGNRTSVSLLVCFTNADNPEESITVRFCGHGIDGADKGPGKAISYAYKYALLKTFNLETGEDPDQDANVAYEPAKCLEFDFEIGTRFSEEDAKKAPRFLEYIAKTMGVHQENVKREALKRPDDFLKKLRSWK